MTTTAASHDRPAARSEAAYRELIDRVREAYLLATTASLLHWDQETMMPAAGLEHRSRQFAQIVRLNHQMATDPRIGEVLAACEDVLRLALAVAEKVTYRIIQTDSTVIGDQLAEALSLLVAPRAVTVAIAPQDRALVESMLPELIDKIKARAHATRGIELETEVQILGEDEVSF